MLSMFICFFFVVLVIAHDMFNIKDVGLLEFQFQSNTHV